MIKLKEIVGVYGINIEFQFGFLVKFEIINYLLVRFLICLYKVNVENNCLKGKISLVKYKYWKIFYVFFMRK